ncbi:hypothetical protein EDM68_00900 [Candidatus Uhrbacteria bacterium]|nr:MAG: hypothetical protein EDM68_00900 [Candidatus Uhrbacteria bacterium]
MSEHSKPKRDPGECGVDDVDESQETEERLIIALYRERRYGPTAVKSEERDIRIHGLEFIPPEYLWVPPDERRKS